MSATTLYLHYDIYDDSLTDRVQVNEKATSMTELLSHDDIDDNHRICHKR